MERKHKKESVKNQLYSWTTEEEVTGASKDNVDDDDDDGDDDDDITHTQTCMLQYRLPDAAEADL